MILDGLREYLDEMSGGEAIVFDNPSFDRSIIGVNVSNGAAVYSLQKMVEELAKEDGISEEEAMEFIDYNTIRALPYCHSGCAPIIVEDLVIGDYLD